MTRIALAFAALLTALCSLPLTATGADWPTRPVRIISPASPGGASDTFARILAENFGEMFGQRFYVENRTGAGGLIGAAAAANAEPDGYTLVTSSIAYTVIAPSAAANPGFDPMKSFTHIAYIGGPPIAFVVHPSLNVRSLADLSQHAQRSAPVTYASPGVGTLGHLMAERLGQRANIKLQHIPNKGGATAVTDVVSGTVNMASMTWSSAAGQVRGGTVIPIAVTASARLPEYPNVPTLKELGYDDLVATTWFALSGPAGLPKDIVDKLNRAVIEILDKPAVRERIKRDAIETRKMTPEEFTQFQASELANWGPLAKRFVQTN
jgi:tripartite-type tricarboxylate transporter receptor subunit TctC